MIFIFQTGYNVTILHANLLIYKLDEADISYRAALRRNAETNAENHHLCKN